MRKRFYILAVLLSALSINCSECQAEEVEQQHTPRKGLAAGVVDGKMWAKQWGEIPKIGPIIKANGATGNVDYSDTVSVTVEMNAGDSTGIDVDWWVVASANLSNWFYLNSALQWTQALFSGNNYMVFHPVYQGLLSNLSSTPVLSGFTLPSGTYDFWFGVDYPMDGILNLNGPILYDKVTVSATLISHGVTTHGWSSFDTLITGQAQADAIKSEVDAYEIAAGRTVAWVAFAHEWNSDGRAFPSIVANSIKSRGATPFIFLNLRTVIFGQTDPLYNLAAINAGQFDSDLSAWADGAKNFGSELIVDWGWEMNIEQPWNGTYNGGAIEGPRRFREAYRHIIELMRNRGATNIRWAFHINFPESPDESWNAFENYYPGDDVIDITGVSIYSAQMPTDTSFPSFESLMDPAYSRLITMAPTKPVFVFEFGATAGNPLGDSVTWANEALAGILSGRWPAVRGFAWWNDYWENDSDPSHDTEMRVEAVPGLATVFKSRLSGSNVGDRPPVLGLTANPLATDFDGDGKADPAMVDNAGNWHAWFSTMSYRMGGPYNLGVAGIPVSADVDGR